RMWRPRYYAVTSICKTLDGKTCFLHQPTPLPRYLSNLSPGGARCAEIGFWGVCSYPRAARRSGAQRPVTVNISVSLTWLQVCLMLWIVIAVIVVIVLIAVAGYNRLVAARNRYKNAFAQIDVQLTRRHDLIPNLVETAKGYMTHERETLEGVIEARNAAVNG